MIAASVAALASGESALNQAQIDGEIAPSDGPCGSGGLYQPTGHMSGVYKPSG